MAKVQVLPLKQKIMIGFNIFISLVLVFFFCFNAYSGLGIGSKVGTPLGSGHASGSIHGGSGGGSVHGPSNNNIQNLTILTFV